MAGKTFKVTVKGPTAGFRAIKKYFGPDAQAFELSEAEYNEIKSEKLLLVVDMPDDFDIASTAPKPAVTLDTLLARCEAQETRIASLEGAVQDLGDMLSELQDAKAKAQKKGEGKTAPKGEQQSLAGAGTGTPAGA